MIWLLFLACKSEELLLPEGWISGEVPEREPPPSANLEASTFGGFYGEFSGLNNSSFSSGTGGFVVIGFDSGGEESFLCGYTFEISYLATADDCEVCSFAFDIYEGAPVQGGDETHCASFDVSIDDLGSQDSSIGYSDGVAYQRNSSGEWEEIGEAEYFPEEGSFSYYDIIGYLD